MLGIEPISPSERLDYDVDFSDWLEDGDTIVAATMSVEPAGELTTSLIITSSVVKVWAENAILGRTYHVIVNARTAVGRKKEECFKLRTKGC